MNETISNIKNYKFSISDITREIGVLNHAGWEVMYVVIKHMLSSPIVYTSQTDEKRIL